VGPRHRTHGAQLPAETSLVLTEHAAHECTPRMRPRRHLCMHAERL
jgi:hypothetical protein